jgi:hypothetical protein
MTVPEPLIAAAAAVFVVVLAALLTDIGIWRRSLAKDLRHLTERVAVVETSIRYMAPRAHSRARHEVEDNGPAP